MISFAPHPADQLGLSEILYVPSIQFCIHCGAPLFVGLQVNHPYFMISTVPQHNLLRTDHLNKNLKQIFTFHFLPKQDHSVAVSVENKYSTLSNVLNVLLSSRQKHECVVEGSERRINLCVLLFETDWNRFFLKHRIQSINIYD